MLRVGTELRTRLYVIQPPGKGGYDLAAPEDTLMVSRDPHGCHLHTLADEAERERLQSHPCQMRRDEGVTRAPMERQEGNSATCPGRVCQPGMVDLLHGPIDGQRGFPLRRG